VATTALLLLLSEKPHYPKLGAYPKYGDFTIKIIRLDYKDYKDYICYYPDLC
jgi:hypothetical protein